MNITRNVIKTVRLREDRAQKLKDKAFDLSMMERVRISEADLINFMIDEISNGIEVKSGKLAIKADQ
jgi:hypothetical protein